MSISKKRIAIPSLLVLLGITIGLTYYILSPNQPAKITTQEIKNAGVDGIVTSSSSTQKPDKSALQAQASELVSYESNPIDIPAKSNAAILEWDQKGDAGVTTEVRTYNGKDWTPWVETHEVDGGKDGVEIAKSSTLILANVIKKIQYRFTLTSNSDQPSAIINASNTDIHTIDSSQGPTGSTPFLQQLYSFFHLNDSASAKADGPRIITRAEWGSPEPDWSTWEPEYQSLGRAIIHHTATTETPNAFVAIRAIWQYHAVNLGWGDIGYNYIVDSAGNIFQGRYFDHEYAATHNVDVVAGHAYDNNRGTTGIAAIGNFQGSSAPTAVQLGAISDIVGYKLAPYDVNPSGNGGFGTAVVGHRDVLPTACPGENLYPRLNDIRTVASQYYMKYNAEHKLDYSFHSQQLTKDGVVISPETVLRPNDNAVLSFDLKNNGSETWVNSGLYATVLGTSSPTDHASSFYNPSTWIGANRPGSFSAKVNPSTGATTTATTIAPGEIGRFNIKLNVPDIQTSNLSWQQFQERFRLVQDGRIWFPRDIGLYFPINVETHAYNWEYVSQNIFTNSSMTTPAPSTLAPNTRYFARVTMKNNGSAAWYKNTFRLGTSQPQDRVSALYDTTWLSQNRAASLTQQSVSPGQNGTFEFWIKTPATPTNSREYFRPVVDGITWLRDIGLYWQINAS